MTISRSRSVGRFDYSISVDDEFWSGEVEFSGIDTEEVPKEEIIVTSSKDYITIEGWRVTNDAVTVSFALEHGSDKKGQIDVLIEDSGYELIHAVVPRPEAIEIGNAFLNGKNALHQVDSLYSASYPSVVSNFTSEVRYLYDFESHTAILNEICKYDNGPMGRQIRKTAGKYFKNMMVGKNKFFITNREELEEKLETYNSFSNLRNVSLEEAREEYLDWWDGEAETKPADFQFEIPAQ